MWMRMLAAAAVLLSGAIHLKLWFDGFRYFDVVGPAFLLNAAGGVGIAVLLVLWRHWVPPLLAAGFGASTLGAFAVSASVGLFGVHETWTGAAVLWAAGSEVVAILAGLMALLQQSPVRPGGQPRVESGERESGAAVRSPRSPDGSTRGR